MTKETMNIHKALCELKILDDRINRAIDDCRYVGVTKIVSKRVGTKPYSLVLERASGTHNNSVQFLTGPTLLHVLCSVPASSSIF